MVKTFLTREQIAKEFDAKFKASYGVEFPVMQMRCKGFIYTQRLADLDAVVELVESLGVAKPRQIDEEVAFGIKYGWLDEMKSSLLATLQDMKWKI